MIIELLKKSAIKNCENFISHNGVIKLLFEGLLSCLLFVEYSVIGLVC